MRSINSHPLSLLAAWTIAVVCLLVSGEAFAWGSDDFVEKDRDLAPCSSEIPHIPFTVGERLEFSVRYIGVKAGVVVMEVLDIVEKKGHTCYHLRGTAWSTGIGDVLYPSYVIIDTYIDVETQRPVYAEQHWHLKRYYEYIDWTFEPENCRIWRTKFKLFHNNDKLNQYEGYYDWDPDSPEEFLFFYRMRHSNCAPETFSFHYLYADQGSYELGVQYLKRDRVRTRFGRKKVDIVEPVYLGDIDSEFTRKTRLQLYFSADERRLPYKVRMSTLFGAGYLMLEDHYIPE